MNMKKAILPISVAGLLYAGLPAQTMAVTQLTSNSDEEAMAQISGSYAVWQGQVSGDWEIFLHDFSTSTTSNISNDPGNNDVAPQTDGTYVTWLSDNGELRVYDIGAASVSTIPNPAASPRVTAPPQIANGKVAWMSSVVTTAVEPGEVYLYDIATSIATNISNSALDDSVPQINDTMVGWVRIDEGVDLNDPSDDVRSYMTYTLPSGPLTVVVPDIEANAQSSNPINFMWPDSPQVDGDRVVSSKSDGSDREIFLKDGANPQQQLTTNAIEDVAPTISGNRIVWVGGTGASAEIYAHAVIVDTDGDGVDDSTDNCTLVPNAPQRDTDADGYGNMCDGDFNNDGWVLGDDLVYFKNAYFTTDPHADFNGDGWVLGDDLVMFKNMYFKQVGPSGVAP